MIARVKGTQDFIDLRLFNFIINQFKKHSTLYHFTEIATPIIEPLELFKRLLGEYTDVVTKEMFVIQPATESSELICLRPEATASTTRLFLEQGMQTTPWKVISHGPMFRHERPQKGRYRQFHQVNIEIIGTNDIAQDTELITMLDRFFHELLQLNNYALGINFLGCMVDRKKYLETLRLFMNSQAAQEICQTCTIRKEKNVLRIFDCKQEACQKIYQGAPHIADHICDQCQKEWDTLQEQLHLLSVSFVYKPTLVRGLDYYRKTVFEFTSENLGAQSAFCGGGRYELAQQLGAKDELPSVGASIGVERLMLLLEPMMDQLQLEQLPRLHLILPLSGDLHPLALLLADELRAQDLCVDILFEETALKNMLRKANKMGAAYALIIGSEERDNRAVLVKNMITGEQKQIQQINVAAYLKGY